MSLKNQFILRGAEQQPLSPRHYGYWSALWAFDIAKRTLADLSDQKYASHPSVNSIRENILPFLVHVSAMYSAAYAAYAFCVLGAPSELFSSTRQGVVVGMGEWLMKLDGLTSSERITMVEAFQDIYGKYVSALIQDWRELANREPNVFYANRLKADELFLDFVSHVYWGKMRPSELEYVQLDFLHITESMLAFYRAQKDEIGISFM